MKKHFLLLTIVLLTAFQLTSQNFIPASNLAESHSEKMPSALLVSNSDTILSYIIKQSVSSVYPVIKYLKQANSYSLDIFKSYYSSMISRVFIHEQLLYFVGKTQFATGDSIRIFVLKTDFQLNPIDTVFIKPFVKNLLYFKVTDNFPEIGVIYVAESPSPTIPKAIYSISFSPEGEVYSHQTAPLEVNTAFLADVTNTPEGNIAVAGHYSIPGVPGTMPGCFMFNDSLTFDRFWVYPPTEEFGFQQYGIVIYSNTHFISSSTAYVSARSYLADTVIGYPQNYRYYIETMLADTAGHVFKSAVFGAGDTTLYPAFAKHLVATVDNSFFIVWTKDIESLLSGKNNELGSA